MKSSLYKGIWTALGFVALLSPQAFAQDSIIARIQQSLPAIVTIESEIVVKDAPRPRRIGITRRYGAGVIIDDRGVIVTNTHTIMHANRINVILHDGTRTSAQVVKVVSGFDFSLLKIKPPYPLTFVYFSDPKKLELNLPVINVGHSKLLRQTISGGKVIALLRGSTPVSGPNTNVNDVNMMRVNINLYRGDSGGPLFDYDGRLIGLMVARQASADRSSFAVSSNEIKKHYKDYVRESKK